QVTEQESAQVLVALLRVDHPEATAVAAVDEGPVRAGDEGVVDLHEAVAPRSNGLGREARGDVVVLGVGPDETEDSLRGEPALWHLRGVPVRGRFCCPPGGGEVRSEVLVHPLRAEYRRPV